MQALEGRRFAAVLFDLDGTLIDSTPAVERSWRNWSERMGVAAFDLADFHGQPARQTVATLIGPDRIDQGLALIGELELSDLDGVVPLPGAARALAALPAERSAIATSCTLPLAKARLHAAQLTPPPVLITADAVAHGKPAPDPYLAAAEQLRVPAEQCLVVEDAVLGLRSAAAAGCATLAVVTTTPRDQLIADAIVTNLAQVKWRLDSDGIAIELSHPELSQT